MTAAPTISVLYPADQIAERVEAIAGGIAGRRHERLLVIAILKGSFVFAADLIRAMHKVGIAPEVEFMSLSSYGAGTESSGMVTILRDVESNVAGRDVILIDDILESGRTLAFARDLITGRGARSVEVAVLLDKPGKRKAEVEADYIGFSCPDRFVVGYGMDAGHSWRQLPFVGVIEDS